MLNDGRMENGDVFFRKGVVGRLEGERKLVDSVKRGCKLGFGESNYRKSKYITESMIGLKNCSSVYGI